MMPSYDQIDAAEQTASQAVKDYVASKEYFETFKNIIDAHKLHIDEAGLLGDALEATFYGAVPAAEFPNLLKEVLEQNKNLYDVLLKDINEKIFAPFRASLQVEESVATPPVKSTEIPVQRATAQPSLERVTGSRSTNVEVDVLNESAEKEAPQKPIYKDATDPYREPIE